MSKSLKSTSNLSFWEQNTFQHTYDVAIIGAGLVGLWSAYFLKENNPKLRVIVLERGLWPGGASVKNAGFACFGSISELLNTINKSDEATMLHLVNERYSGIKNIKHILGKKAINYSACGGYDVFTPKNQKLYEESTENIAYINTLLKDIVGKNVYKHSGKGIEKNNLQGITHLIKNQYEGSLDTGEMVKTLLNKVRKQGTEIIFNANVESYESANSVEIIGKGFNVKAQKLLLTTNAYTKALWPEAEITPGRGQVLITEPIEGLKLHGTFHLDQGYTYFRNVENRVLIGGGRNLNFEGETTTTAGTTAQIQSYLEDILSTIILPNTPYKIAQRWSGTMAFDAQQTPIIQAISPNVFAAIRCNGMGVAISSRMGQKVAKMIG